VIGPLASCFDCSSARRVVLRGHPVTFCLMKKSSVAIASARTCFYSDSAVVVASGFARSSALDVVVVPVAVSGLPDRRRGDRTIYSVPVVLLPSQNANAPKRGEF